MTVRNLDKIFKPQRVAVIGATDEPSKVGYTVLRNMVTGGFQGVVYPVNAKREAVQGIQAYPDVASLPRPADLAVICTPSKTVPGLIHDLGIAGTRGVVVISAGFREMGKEGRALEDQVKAAAANFPGMRIIGPNCLGIIAPGVRLNASFAAAMPAAGGIALISQSGALCTAVLDWAIDQGIGFSFFVSIGNQLDVTMGDLIDYFGSDDATRAMILYAESIQDPRGFMSAARAFSRQKPIVAYKAGRFADSAKAAASHTGALAGVDAVYEAAFQRAGIVRVFETDAMFDCAELLARQPRPQGDRLAIITNAGGPGVIASDTLLAHQGRLAKLSPSTYQKLNDCLPPFWSHNNPVDVLGDAPADRYAAALETVLHDPENDGVLVILTPQSMTDPIGTARALIRVGRHPHKPILTAWMGAAMVSLSVQTLNSANIPTYRTPENAVRAFMNLVAYSRNVEVLHETPRDLSIEMQIDRPAIHAHYRQLFANSPDLVDEETSKRLLAAYGIPVTLPEPALSADEAVAVAQRMGYPVVLKILSPQITHKTDVGGVKLNLHDEAAVRTAFAEIVASAREHRPDAEIQGVTVQKMVTVSGSFELIVGMKQDPVFGAVLLVGAGGVTAELYQDRALGLPPLNERLARRMLESLRSWPMLQGYRGRARANVDQLLEIILRFSYLVADFPEIAELDINPLVVGERDCIALDARVVLNRAAVEQEPKRYSHLAIRPYPEEYVRAGERLKDGAEYTLRPIRPEDEPQWHALLARCSAETIKARFGYLFERTTHALASRFCMIDYDRELAIVAEATEQGEKRIVGVGRLIADLDHHEAEFSLLVVDNWQHRGLGSRITDYCLEIASGWGIQSIYAETTTDNARMLAVFKARGFQMEQQAGGEGVLVKKQVQ